jgi:hypothetical protein
VRGQDYIRDRVRYDSRNGEFESANLDPELAKRCRQPNFARVLYREGELRQCNLYLRHQFRTSHDFQRAVMELR